MKYKGHKIDIRFVCRGGMVVGQGYFVDESTTPLWSMSATKDYINNLVAKKRK